MRPEDYHHCRHCPCSWWDHRGPYHPDGAGCNGRRPDDIDFFRWMNAGATGRCLCVAYAPLARARSSEPVVLTTW